MQHVVDSRSGQHVSNRDYAPRSEYFASVRCRRTTRLKVFKLRDTLAIVHSKVVVIDPYGTNPVVMTGSHNMGPSFCSLIT
jgi:phosphatidylserine/phosphatidylglycerophosphate/cardiolipin synthase-like enzyme